jgi:uncharacterized YkwD family protein/spore coat assembly protein SafA
MKFKVNGKEHIMTYIVKPNDTLWKIAKDHNISLNELLALNPQITNPSLIFPGQTINIPSIISEPSEIKALEQEVIRLVNEERTRIGRKALTENDKLSNVARIKSQDFINNNYFSHNSPTYGSPSEMLRRFNIPFTAIAENIGQGQQSAREVMNDWMNSTMHRNNILNSTYNQIGVGVARDENGRLYWTQIFISN